MSSSCLVDADSRTRSGLRVEDPKARECYLKPELNEYLSVSHTPSANAFPGERGSSISLEKVIAALGDKIS